MNNLKDRGLDFIPNKNASNMPPANNNPNSPKQSKGTEAKTAKQKRVTHDFKKQSTKAKESAAKNNIIEVIDDVAKSESENEGIDKHVKARSNRNYGELIFIQQYQQMLEQYRKFLDAYLKEYLNAPNDNVVILDYNDLSRKEKRRKFDRSQEVMTYTEIKDIVLRKRMNWLLGAEHNYVSPDEKERYKFWKLFNKFNYVMAEGCMFYL